MTPLPLVAVIPAYQAEASIEKIVSQTLAWVAEVWVGDDGSTDKTALLAKKAGAKVIRFETNQGKGAMLRALFGSIQNLSYSAVITLDADGQHSPNVIPEFWRVHLKFPQALLLGNRSEGSIPFLRRYANVLASQTLSYLSGQSIKDSQCGMRLIPYEILTCVKTGAPRFVMETEFLWETIKAGFKIYSVPLAACYPEGWTSHFQRWDDTWDIASYLVQILKARLTF